MLVPSAAEAAERLAMLHVDPEDALAAVNARHLLDERELQQLVADRATELRSTLGLPGPLDPWPDLLPQWGRVGRLVYPWVFVTALPDVLDYQQARGIDRAIALASLANIAHQMRRHRLLYGYPGLHEQDWVTRHFRGLIYVLGRLHFERARWTGASAAPLGGPDSGEPVLDLHIPSGALTPESCDSALALARQFFAAHFPEEKYRYATCTSWILDPQLASYLSASTNIIRFQRRFRLDPDVGPDKTRTLIDFVFDRDDPDLDTLPRDTSLQRGIIAHARAGRPWHFRRGWFSL